MEPSKKTVAVVLNYNDADTALALLRRLERFESLAGIVVVDNASEDTSRLRIREYCKDRPNMHPLFSPKNGGYGSGNNRGIRYAKEMLGAGRALVCNPDVDLTEETFLELSRLMDRHRAAAAAPQIKRKERETEVLGNFLPPAFPIRPWGLDLLECEPILRRLLTPFLYYKKSRFRPPVSPVDCLWGSLLLLDIDAFIKVGGFDEGIFLYKEESVLGHRLKAAGYKTILCNRIFFSHRGGATIEKNTASLLVRQRIREKSTLYYYKKYLKKGFLAMTASFLFFRLIEAEIACYRLLFGRNPL